MLSLVAVANTLDVLLGLFLSRDRDTWLNGFGLWDQTVLSPSCLYILIFNFFSDWLANQGLAGESWQLIKTAHNYYAEKRLPE